MIGFQALLGSAQRTQRVGMQALIGSPEQAQSLLQSFKDGLKNATDLDKFEAFLSQQPKSVALPSQQPVGFFDWLYQQDPTVFDTIATKFKDVALPEVEEKQSEKFIRLMSSLPLRPSTDPATGVPLTFDLFDCAQPQTLENCYRDIFNKWLAVWPVPAHTLPNNFSSWLSGKLYATTTSETTSAEDLKKLRAQALQVIYERWLNADLRKEMKSIFQPQEYAGFMNLVQLVPSGFWDWPEQVAEYLDKRVEVWETILTAWNGVRPLNTGWNDMPFIQSWSLANDSPWSSPSDIAEKYPDALKAFEVFRRSRRGRIWA